jgi:VanZ family protein
VTKARSFLKYWLPLLVWMAVIFSASADTQSWQHSSRIIAPLLRWFFPHIPEPTVNEVVVFARKCAHLTEYAILSVLFLRALRKPVKNDPRPWPWRQVGWCILFVALYACSDEFHQRFVPTRQPSIRDVIIDTAGGLLGLLVLWAAASWRRVRRPSPPS